MIKTFLKYAFTTGMSSKDFVEKSSVYKEFKAELEEINKHKWIESEKAGEDIGFDRALLDWTRFHKKGWKESRKNPQHRSTEGA